MIDQNWNVKYALFNEESDLKIQLNQAYALSNEFKALIIQENEERERKKRKVLEERQRAED